ncbi:hypothetical protein [Novosphingobium rosa]|uniref:hypothetical protein n=1 Tax=Novosphingobium rosa TaxID=76978 RepID=UPI000829B445|nr:hypothetical protein [Novosphingobium rosa]
MRGSALRLSAAFAITALLAAPLVARPKPKGPQPVSALGGYAQVSEIVASAIAWNRRAADKGWAEGTHTYAAPDGQILIGTATPRAQGFIKSKGAEPPASFAPAAHRRTHHVWMSCDGSIAAEEGLFENGATHGWYLTLWQRQPKKGDYKWVLDQSAPDAAAPDFDFIEGKVADCVPRARGQAPAPEVTVGPNLTPDGSATGPVEVKPIAPGSRPVHVDVKGETNHMPDYLIGLAKDRTLSWATKFDPDGTRHLTIHLLLDGKRTEVLNRTVAPGAANGQ